MKNSHSSLDISPPFRQYPPKLCFYYQKSKVHFVTIYTIMLHYAKIPYKSMIL